MGIRIKILISLALIFAIEGFSYASSGLKERSEEAYTLIDTDPEAGNALYEDVITDAQEAKEWKLVVKSNYILGWSQEYQFDNLGRAVIYYLEGVRYAENFDYRGSQKDLVKGLEYTGRIFSRFDDYENSLKYYSRAMELAKDNKFFDLYSGLLVSMARLHFDMGNHQDALTLLDASFEYFHKLDNRTIADIYNDRGAVFSALGRMAEALSEFRKLQEFVRGHEDLETEFIKLSLHNIGNAYMDQGQWANAAESFKKALSYKIENKASSNSIFITLSDLGECFLELDLSTEANTYFQKAEQLLQDDVIDKPRVYHLYKLISRMHLREENMQSYTQYQDLYGTTMESYLSEQQQIESTDKKYNLELITKRYFQLVAEQERSRQLRQFAQGGGLALIFIIISIVGYYQYSRYRLRKDLEVSLRPYAETVYVE